MDPIKSLKIKGLFGHVDYDLDLRTLDRATIITGPNGSGKTHILNLLNASLQMNFRRLRSIPFGSVEVEFDSGRILRIHRLIGGNSHFKLELRPSRRARYRSAFVTVQHSGMLEERVGPNWYRFEEDMWIDRRDDEIVSTDELIIKYYPELENAFSYTYSYGERSGPSDFDDLALPPVTLVEIRRLDPLAAPLTVAQRRATRQAAGRPRVNQYVDRIRFHINDAKRRSLNESQRRDTNFAIRALSAARADLEIDAEELRDRYQAISDLHAQLQENGLAEGPIALPFPEGPINDPESRIISVFLNDWRDKLAPLLPVHEKLRAFQRIFDNKLSGKHVELTDGEVRFWTDHDHEPLEVTALSSGEQHLLALFTMLLFHAEAGGIVLIDEPEISLHAAWKESFLEDISEVAEASDLQVVMATHSVSIIGGRWDLTEELVSE